MDQRFQYKSKTYKTRIKHKSESLQACRKQRFLRAQITQSIREKCIKLEFIKIKTLFSLGNIIKKMQRQITDWEKGLTIHISDEGPE